MNPKNPTRAVLYTRVSTDEQAEHGTSLAGQLAACLAKAEAVGAQVVWHYEDAGVSGAYYATRPGLQSALAALEEGRADTLIVANVSRLSRDAEHQAAIRKRVAAAGGRLAFCDLHIDDTPEGGFVFGMMGQFAQYERQVIRERTAKGRRRRAEEGLQPSRAVSPWGYRVVTTGDVLRGEWPADALGTYQVVGEQAAHAREVFRRCAAGESLRSIANHLNAAGVPTTQGGKAWYATSLHCILRNPVYKGVGAFGRKERHTDERRKSEQGLRTVAFNVRVPESEWVTFAAPALVDEATWDACQGRLDTNQQRQSGNPKRRYLLSGLARCPLCGKAMGGYRRDGVPGYYRCREAVGCSKHRPDNCPAGTCPLNVLEGLVLRGIRAIAAQPGYVGAAIEAWRRGGRGGAAAEAAEAARKECGAKLAALDRREKATVSAQIAGIASGARPEFYAAEFAEIARRRAEQTARREGLAPAAGAGDALEAEPQKAGDVIARALKALDEVLAAEEITDAEKRGLLGRVVEKVVPETDFGRGGLRGCVMTVAPPFLRAEGVQTVHRIGMCSRMRSTASWTRSPFSSPVRVRDMRT